METEWQLLEDLATANRTSFASVIRLQDEFRILMRESPAWVGRSNERRIETEHELRYVYPRYYPSLPLEGYFVRPVLHANVDAVTGFVCLWKDYRPAQTIVDAIHITRAIMACKVANWDLAHRMQEASVLERSGAYALSMPSLTIPASCRPLLPRRSIGSKRRLTSELDNQGVRENSFAFSDTE
ncbi:MAG TPA: hypothetical protein VGM27_13685 [Acidobacteriaceae bacterium]